MSVTWKKKFPENLSFRWNKNVIFENIFFKVYIQTYSTRQNYKDKLFFSSFLFLPFFTYIIFKSNMFLIIDVYRLFRNIVKKTLNILRSKYATIFQKKNYKNK